MNKIQRVLLGVATSAVAATGLAVVGAAPASADIAQVVPGRMECGYGTVTVEAPTLATRQPEDYGALDQYIPVLEILMEDGRWEPLQVGERAFKLRSTDTWILERTDGYGLPVAAYRHTFDVQPGYYYRVTQGVKDGETERQHQVEAVLANHDPEVCDATGPWS